MTSNQRLSGIFTPNIVPLDAHGEINEEETRRYVDWLIERGVHGLYPNGSTGEFTRFTVEERQRIIEIIADQTAGRVPILAGGVWLRWPPERRRLLYFLDDIAYAAVRTPQRLGRSSLPVSGERSAPSLLDG